jgi:competence ComEA-like helix-hairpin-helix protein
MNTNKHKEFVKCLIKLVIISIIILLLISLGASANALGDINNDGQIDVLDVALALKQVLGLELLSTEHLGIADVNNDGVVDVQDVALILQKSLLLIDKFPDTSEPSPDPGLIGSVNINTASFEDLQLIIHIGPDRAQEIIDLRPFSSLNQLTQVSGIGASRLQDIIDEGIAYVE